MEDEGKHEERAGKKRKAEKRINCWRGQEERGGRSKDQKAANS